MIIKSHTHSCVKQLQPTLILNSLLQLELTSRNVSRQIKGLQPLIHSWILTFTVRRKEGKCGVAEVESNILTRKEKRRGKKKREIILSNKSNKGSAEAKTVRWGRGGSINKVDKATGIQNPAKTRLLHDSSTIIYVWNSFCGFYES